MDPFAALNVAANIIQFVGYTRDVYTQIREIRMSAAGMTKKDADVIWSASELHGMVDTISSGIEPLEKAPTAAERKIHDLGRRCQELSKTISADIEQKRAKSQSNVFSAAKVVLRMKWKTSEIDDKLAELNDIQDVLFKNLIIHISTQQNGLGRAMIGLLEQNRKLEISRGEDIARLKNDLLEAVSPMRTFRASTSRDGETNSKLVEIKTMLETFSERASGLQREQAIVSSLYFDGMLHRQEEISQAYTKTFSWVYDERLHVKQWLAAKEGMVYWISGDAGSGKSTLTKFLSNDQEMHEGLERWAAPRKLVKAAFYFWFSGSRLQKSQEGLLRSLLFEVFGQCPEIISSACPTRWTQGSQKPWTRLELMETIHRLSLELFNSRFCFFIDGLDEYQGDFEGNDSSETASHVSDIIDVINTLSKLPYIKLCISSRPWHAFEEAFGTYHKLYVNEENRQDIQLYVKKKFRMSAATLGLHQGYQGPGINTIVEEIVESSRGVFLWVALVVESLLRGLTNKDRMAELRERLRTTPRTLNGFFDRMLESVEDVYHEQAAQILQVALYSAKPQSVAVYAYIGDSDHNALETPIRPWSGSECQRLAETTDTRIKVRCPDLLKIRRPAKPATTAQEMNDHQVDFLHRTVRDFLSIDDTQRRLKQRLKPGFRPGMCLCHGLLTQFKGAALHQRSTLAGISADLFSYAKRVELDLEKPNVEFMNTLLGVLEYQGWSSLHQGEGFSCLGLVVAAGLHHYVAAMLSDTLKSQHQNLASLLNGALNSYPWMLLTVPRQSPQMVNLLLRHGAQPNRDSPTSGRTIWQEFLLELYQADSSAMTDSQGGRALQEDLAAIVQSLLEHGADPNVECVVGRTEPRTTVGKGAGIRYPIKAGLLDMLRKIFPADKLTYLEALVHEKRASQTSCIAM